MNQSAPVAFLFDVDNTLLDNDRIAADLMDYPASKSEALTKAGCIEEKGISVGWDTVKIAPGRHANPRARIQACGTLQEVPA
jgi:hypothetical protein